MWKKGSPDSDDTRLLKVGLAEMARWTGAHKTSCRAYIRALIDKLAIEEAETFNSAAGKDGARVYRIFSFSAILERRQRANMTHVVRTGAVWFVDPRTGSRLLPGSNLLTGSNLLSGGNLPSDSNLHTDPDSSQGSEPGSNLQPLIKNRDQQDLKTSTNDVTDLEAAIRIAEPMFDRNAVEQIWIQSREAVSDCSAHEVAQLFQLKAAELRRLKTVTNFNGLMLSLWRGYFTQGLVNRLRENERNQAEEERRQWESYLNNPDATEELRQLAAQALEKLKRSQ